jgi:hypothetical protein
MARLMEYSAAYRTIACQFTYFFTFHADEAKVVFGVIHKTW